jgi:hypothetical protein
MSSRAPTVRMRMHAHAAPKHAANQIRVPCAAPVARTLCASLVALACPRAFCAEGTVRRFCARGSRAAARCPARAHQPERRRRLPCRRERHEPAPRQRHPRRDRPRGCACRRLPPRRRPISPREWRAARNGWGQQPSVCSRRRLARSARRTARRRCSAGGACAAAAARRVAPIRTHHAASAAARERDALRAARRSEPRQATARSQGTRTQPCTLSVRGHAEPCPSRMLRAESVHWQDAVFTRCSLTLRSCACATPAHSCSQTS